MIRRISIMVAVLIAFPLCSSAQSSREIRQWTDWCRSIGGYVRVTQSNPICIPPASTPTLSSSPEGPDPQVEERERLRKEKEQKAADADQNGMQAANRGNWEEAINFFLTALSFAPDNQTIRTHLFQARTALSDTRSAQEMAAVRQRIEGALAAADIQALRQNVEVEFAVQQVKTLNESFADQNTKTEKIGSNNTPRIAINRHEAGPKRLYPFSRQPISAHSPAGEVLESNQAKIKALDLQILNAQKALRDLIKLNLRSEEERLEWTKQSEEATIAAEDLSINLVLDLVDAHLDHQIKANNKERSELLTKIFSRTESREVGVHTIYGMFLNQLDRLNYRKDIVYRVKRQNDLKSKIRNFSMEDKNSPWEKFYDLVTENEKIDELAGPYKDLVDAAYTIYKQAASLEVLAITLNNQEKTYQASERLRLHILKLIAQKKKLS